MNSRDQAQQSRQTYVTKQGVTKKDNTADDYDFAAMRANLGQKGKQAALAQGAVKVARPGEQAIQVVQPHCAAAPQKAPQNAQAPAAASGFVDPLVQRQQAGKDRHPVTDDHDFAALRANLGNKPVSAAKRAQDQVYITKPTTSLS
ncbi:hypothetical protein DIPPA_30115 [Diplonema papillatum]|nr:hypothetical protein DIPPA_30115 [Diplonema papillatum]